MGAANDDAVAEFKGNLSSLKANGGVTRIGSAIRTLVRRLEARNEPVAGLFLFTDGRHTGGAPDPVSAAQTAAGLSQGGAGGGIPIYPIPIGDPFDSIGLWVHRPEKPPATPQAGPPPELYILVRDAARKQHRICLGSMDWSGWWLIHKRVDPGAREALEHPCLFVGIEIDAGASLIATIVVVLLVDAASSSIRRRIITGQPSTSLVSKGMIAITGAGRAPSTELET